MVLLINGTDYGSKVTSGGLTWSKEEIAASGKTRMLDASLRGGRIAEKVRLSIAFQPLLTSEANVLFGDINEEFVAVEYIDPADGHVEREMTCTKKPANLMLVLRNNTEYWDGIEIELEER